MTRVVGTGCALSAVVAASTALPAIGWKTWPPPAG
jgi:hydroxyethylthiazole kinase-like sugar kinase family protein